MGTAAPPLHGTIYDARGAVVRQGVDPRLARAQAFFSSALPGSHLGARTDHRGLQEWTPLPASPDADSIGDLPTLRARSRDLVRNAPLAAGAINTVVTNAIGTGLSPQPRVDSDYLIERYRITEEQADAFERQAARLWRLQSEGRFFDVAGLHTHQELQDKVLRAVLESGDVLGLRRYKKGRPGSLFGHCGQLIEADRVANPDTEMDREGFAGGVESDPDGAPIAYHVASRYPYELAGFEPIRWTRVLAMASASGERQVRHIAWRRRIRQSRGIPYLAVVILPLKQLDRYGDAELMAAVISSLFTVFIKSGSGLDPFPDVDAATAAMLQPRTVGLDVPTPPKYKLGSGAIVKLQPEDDITIADPKRPNALYDPFVQSKLREIGVALEIPFELLIKHFTASYSAARASRLEFWKFVTPVRNFVARGFCQPDYDALISEAVGLGYLDAPGYFEDPLARQAWNGCWWVGPAPGQIDEEGEVDAAVTRIEQGLSTLEEETAALTGGNWERNHRQRVKEVGARRRDGLEVDEGAEAEDRVAVDRRVDGRDRDEGARQARTRPRSELRRRIRAVLLDELDDAERRSHAR